MSIRVDIEEEHVTTRENIESESMTQKARKREHRSKAITD